MQMTQIAIALTELSVFHDSTTQGKTTLVVYERAEEIRGIS